MPFSIISENETVIAAGFETTENLLKRLEPLEKDVVEQITPKFEQAVIDYNNGDIKSFTKFATKQTGTNLQNTVWKYLSQISNETISYKQLADEIGRSKAIRAVASACGANKCMMLVPCHRVIKSDKGLGGYYYGLKIKQDLLNHEANHTKTKDN